MALGRRGQARTGTSGPPFSTLGVRGPARKPRAPLPRTVRNEWTARTSKECGYGDLIRVDGEDAVGRQVRKAEHRLARQRLKHVPLEWNGAAGHRQIVHGGSRRGYPSAEQSADAWDSEDGREELDYFRNNTKHGITTHQDPHIQDRLEETQPALVAGGYPKCTELRGYVGRA